MSPSCDFALLITWTTYGTWLPGDRRGYVSNTRKARGGFEPLQNMPGTPVTEEDAETRHLARELQKYPTVWLTSDQAICAARAFINAAVERGWSVLRGAVMANHVHLVVADCPDDGPVVRRIFKGVGQAMLNHAHGTPRRWFTHGGSDRYKHGGAAVAAAIDYVARQNQMLAAIEKNRLIEIP